MVCAGKRPAHCKITQANRSGKYKKLINLRFSPAAFISVILGFS